MCFKEELLLTRINSNFYGKEIDNAVTCQVTLDFQFIMIVDNPHQSDQNDAICQKPFLANLAKLAGVSSVWVGILPLFVIVELRIWGDEVRTTPIQAAKQVHKQNQSCIVLPVVHWQSLTCMSEAEVQLVPVYTKLKILHDGEIPPQKGIRELTSCGTFYDA